jgi:prepilin-type N-terminal cleavage/methylation domain-containing protein
MRAQGFTLIELMIALAIGSILLVLAVPQYASWMADNQVHAGAQLVADGVRRAHGEAVKRNRLTEFVIDPTTKTGGWTVQPAGGGTADEVAVFAEGADKVTFTMTPAAARTLTFSGIGTIAPNADTTAPFTRVVVASPISGTRPLWVEIEAGRTGVKICDPYWNSVGKSDDPKACPHYP